MNLNKVIRIKDSASYEASIRMASETLQQLESTGKGNSDYAEALRAKIKNMM